MEAVVTLLEAQVPSHRPGGAACRPAMGPRQRAAAAPQIKKFAIYQWDRDKTGDKLSYANL